MNLKHYCTLHRHIHLYYKWMSAHLIILASFQERERTWTKKKKIVSVVQQLLTKPIIFHTHIYLRWNAPDDCTELEPGWQPYNGWFRLVFALFLCAFLWMGRWTLKTCKLMFICDMQYFHLIERKNMFTKIQFNFMAMRDMDRVCWLMNIFWHFDCIKFSTNVILKHETVSNFSIRF